MLDIPEWFITNGLDRGTQAPRGSLPAAADDIAERLARIEAILEQMIAKSAHGPHLRVKAA